MNAAISPRDIDLGNKMNLQVIRSEDLPEGGVEQKERCCSEMRSCHMVFLRSLKEKESSERFK